MIWSSNFAYIVGLITTDGNLSSDGRHLSLTSKDREQIENFARVLHLKNKISVKSSGFATQRKYYVIQFGNRKLYNFLISLGLHANKTKSLKELTIPNKYFADFLRGHLDGDGYTHSYWDKRWKSSFLLYTGFVSASKIHLIWIQEKIFQLYKIKGALKYNGRSTFQLKYAKKNSIILLEKMYYTQDLICLRRKRFKIEKALGIIQKQAGMLELVDRLS